MYDVIANKNALKIFISLELLRENILENSGNLVSQKCGHPVKRLIFRLFLSVSLPVKTFLPPLNELPSMNILSYFSVCITPSEKNITPKATFRFKLRISKKMTHCPGHSPDQVDLATRPPNWCVMRTENIYLNHFSKDGGDL